MFCPQCGTNQNEDLRFCKVCGANLHAVRQAVTTREPGGKIDWSKTWVAEMFLSESERNRRELELEVQRGITPEIKRYKEIKAGVIVSSLGVALMLVLGILMEGVVLSGNFQPGDAEVLRCVWAAGLIPFFIGIALMINGLIVSKKIVAAVEREQRARAGLTDALTAHREPARLPAADTTEFIPADFSVTEDTTKHLPAPHRQQ